MIYFLKKLYLQELKGMQRSKLGMGKKNHKLCQWCMKWYGVGSRGGASTYETLLSTPPDNVSFDCSPILASK